MASKSYVELSAQANEVQNEIVDGGNTKQRIADFFRDVIDSLLLLSGKNTVKFTDEANVVPNFVRVVYIDASNNDVSVTLPSSLTFKGNELVIKRLDDSENTVTIYTLPTTKLDGVTSFNIGRQHEFINIAPDILVNGWHMIGRYDINEAAEYHLGVPPEVVAINPDGVTYTQIPNMSVSLGNGFETDGNDMKKTYQGGTFVINGTSDLSVNKATDIFYGLFVNGDVVPSEITHHTFTNQDKTSNISITGKAVLDKGALVSIRAKGDGTSGVALTVEKLDVTFVKVD